MFEQIVTTPIPVAVHKHYSLHGWLLRCLRSSIFGITAKSFGGLGKECSRNWWKQWWVCQWVCWSPGLLAENSARNTGSKLPRLTSFYHNSSNVTLKKRVFGLPLWFPRPQSTRANNNFFVGIRLHGPFFFTQKRPKVYENERLTAKKLPWGDWCHWKFYELLCISPEISFRDFFVEEYKKSFGI